MEKYLEFSVQAWLNIPRIRDRSCGVLKFLDRVPIAHFWIAFLPLQAIPCLYIAHQAKDSDRSGLHLLGEIPLFCEIFRVRQFLSIIFPSFQNRAWDCAGFSQYLWIQVAPGSGHQEHLVWIGTFWNHARRNDLNQPVIQTINIDSESMRDSALRCLDP